MATLAERRAYIKNSYQNPGYIPPSSPDAPFLSKVFSGGDSNSSGGEGGNIIGFILIIIGLFLIWAAFRGKARPLLNAITGDTNFDVKLDSLANAIGPLSSSSGGSSSGGSHGSGNQPDSGTHMGIDSNGNVVVIDKPYGAMTDAEKDAANNFAHTMGG